MENSAKVKTDAGVIKDQAESLSDFIRSTRNLTISFLSVLLYIGVSAWSTTDLDLLKDTPIRLPLVGLEIPIQGFYIIVPWLVVAVFFNLMFHLHTIASRCQWLLDLYDQDPVEYGKVTDRLPIYPFVTLCFSRPRPLVLSVLFAALFLFTEVMAPLFIVTLLLVKFLAYQDSSGSWWQWIAVCVCATTAIFFWWRTLSLIDTTITIARYIKWLVTGFGAITILASGFIVYVSPAVLYDRANGDLDELVSSYEYWHAADESERQKRAAAEGNAEATSRSSDTSPPRSGLPFGLSDWARIEIGPGEMVVKNEPEAKHINRLTKINGENETHSLTDSLSHILGVDLRHCLLIGAQLSEAYLPNINLNDVILVLADLQGTNLTGAALNLVKFKNVQMSNTDFTSATIKDTELIDTPLHGVVFTKASLFQMALIGQPVVEKVIGPATPCEEISPEVYRGKIPCLEEEQAKPTIASFGGQLADETQSRKTTERRLNEEREKHDATKKSLAQLEERRQQLEQDLQLSEARVASLKNGANDDELIRQELIQAREQREILRRENADLQARLSEETRRREGAQLAIAQANEAPTDAIQTTTSEGLLIECEVCPEMVKIPSGSFIMGSPDDEVDRSLDEGPQREVAIDSFYLSQYEVTFDQWDVCAKEKGCNRQPSDSGWGRGQRPVINVSWDDVQEYVAWINNKTGTDKYRLPTEAEWEYATRAGSSSAFWWGDSITTDQANYDGDFVYNGPKGVYRGKTLPVGSFDPNSFGLYDVHGNVYEWVEDCRNDSYKGTPSDGSAREEGDCARRVLRGGSWGSKPWWLRSAGRDWNLHTDRNFVVGFRLARTN
ncbi:MAG: SUMF1/EgtB/PvdO family nonheme iron enzyme [Gammaproteobacteria bacterium]|nr:SUMF1/EgtB/PvdO family nonheme iron enzyme [Gammaproteobacteria bacterium]